MCALETLTEATEGNSLLAEKNSKVRLAIWYTFICYALYLYASICCFPVTYL